MEAREQEIADLTSRIASLAPASVTGDQPAIDVSAMLEELSVMREQRSRLTELLPSIGITAGDAHSVPDETWRELELAAGMGAPLRSAGYSIKEVAEAVEHLRTTAAEEPSMQEGIHDWPPIITLSNDEFRFESNSAELTPEFRDRLVSDITDMVNELLVTYDVDVIEVVGHTDEQPIYTSRESTLDLNAIGALSGDIPISDLVPVDNAGLGLARAISVANALRNALGPVDVEIIPLSAAQLVLPGDSLSLGAAPAADEDRRRIEIRVRRKNAEMPT